jgi:membrane associated rhomboid family serine protease
MDRELRVTPDRGRAEEWSLVLSSVGISHRVEPAEQGWVVYVAEDDAERADQVLQAYAQENRPTAVADPPPMYGSSWLGAAVALGLLAFFLVTGEGARGSRWFERGAADAELIVHGELWRVVTALTLHFDLAHLLGNAAACLVLVTGVAQWIGSGSAAWLLLLSGALGNLLTALTHRAHHISVGASTALFSAIGLLCAMQLISRRRQRAPGRRPWVAVAASLALFGLLGTSPSADLLAHGFGFVLGVLLGTIAGLLYRRPFARWIEQLLAVVCGAAVVASWLLAFHAG